MKVLSNYALPHDELASRRKALADLDKQKKEQEEVWAMGAGYKVHKVDHRLTM